jgi:hypothetical protein
MDRKSEKEKPSLLFCLIMDALGCITYILPFASEWTDIFFAPLSAYIFYRVFGGKNGKIGALINFIEELMPSIDFIPTFTIAYFFRKRYNK